MSERARGTVVRLGVLLALVLLSLLLLFLALQWEPESGPNRADRVEAAGFDPVVAEETTHSRKAGRVHVGATRPDTAPDSVAQALATSEVPVPATRTIAAVVTGADGRLIAGAAVQVRHNNPAYVFDDSRWRWKQTTDVAGVAEIELPMPGYYEVRARSGMTGCLPVALNLTIRGAGIHLRLAPVIRLTGLVRERGGEPVADVRVTIVWVGADGQVTRTAGHAGPDGRFALSDAPVRDLQRLDVAALPAGRPESRFSFLPDDLPAPPHLDLVLADVQVVGRCVDADGDPVAGATVVIGRGARARASTRPNGEFSFRLVPERGDRAIVYAPPNAALGIVLPPPDPAGVVQLGDLVLTAGEPLEGWLVDAVGRPIAGARVALHVFADNSALVDVTHVDAQGHFRFENVGDGPHRVSVHVGGWQDPLMPVVHDGAHAGERGLRFQCPDDGRVMLAIDGETRAPDGVQRAVTVTFTEPGESIVRGEIDVFVGTDRGFSAPAGVYDVHVRSRWFRDHVLPGVRIEAGDERPTVLRLRPEEDKRR